MDDHQQRHYDQARFLARNVTAGVGLNCGREAAIASAKGTIQGGIDELVTMMGAEKAFEEVMRVADTLVRAPGEPSKLWTPNGGGR